MRPRCDDLSIDEKPLNSYGSLEGTIRAIRDHRPLDLNAERWREAHPTGSHGEWRTQARRCLRDGLHYDAGPVSLEAETLDRQERDGLIVERIRFNTAPWFRVDGYFLRPAGVTRPMPGMVVMHAWGGPMIFGKEREVNSGRDHPLLADFRASTYGGRYLAEEYARRGYAVIVIDSYHFGERAPRGIGDLPARYDPFALTRDEAELINRRCGEQLYLGVRQLMWAGTTWMGVLFNDDSRCVDYLLSRPEVDPRRIGCTGLSGGGWRTNMLAALDGRVAASVSVGWMTTGDHQQLYNMRGAIGTFCLLPGVWSHLDLPDLPIMGAPCASMVVLGELDDLVPQAGAREAARQIAAGYRWAGHGDRFLYHHPPKPHVYDAEVQAAAFAWFDRWLGGSR
jgi:dienelactone hydrolase